MLAGPPTETWLVGSTEPFGRTKDEAVLPLNLTAKMPTEVPDWADDSLGQLIHQAEHNTQESATKNENIRELQIVSQPFPTFF